MTNRVLDFLLTHSWLCWLGKQTYAYGMLRKANAISDANLISLRDRGDVVSPIVLKYGL